MSLLGTSCGSGSDTIDGSSSMHIISHQSSPTACDSSTISTTSVEQPLQPYYFNDQTQYAKRRSGRKRRFNHLRSGRKEHRSMGCMDDMKMDDLYRLQNHPQLQRRRRTEPMGCHDTHRLTNDSNNNYYSRIRFSRQTQEFLDDLEAEDFQEEEQRPFPERAQDYIHFRRKYKFYKKGGNRELLGYGAQSAVYKVRLVRDRDQKFAAKISTYRSLHERSTIIHENRLLHRFGNGLWILDLYDDTVNQRLVFIQPHGRDLKSWWNGNRSHKAIKDKFLKEDCMKQEWILKKMIFQILQSLKRIHDAGYIHHDIKPQNILVTKCERTRSCYDLMRESRGEYTYDEDWIDRYSFHVIDYGLSVPCARGMSIAMDPEEIRFGTFGYNAWELMQTHIQRNYDHSIDLYALGVTICELIMGSHPLRNYSNFKRAQEDFCFSSLIRKFQEEERDHDFEGFDEHDIYKQTLYLKCEHWRRHFRRRNGVSSNGDESVIRSIVVREIQYNTAYTTRFKNFISNVIRDNAKRRISSVEEAMNHDLFYNL